MKTENTLTFASIFDQPQLLRLGRLAGGREASDLAFCVTCLTGLARAPLLVQQLLGREAVEKARD
jgi:hypothetical protein